MERLQEGFKRSGNTLETDPKLRLATRPYYGSAFQDLGSSLMPSKTNSRDAKKPGHIPSQSQGRTAPNFKPASGRHDYAAPSSSNSVTKPQARTTSINGRRSGHSSHTQHSCEESSSSSDEMNLLSGSRTDNHETRRRTGSKRTPPPVIDSLTQRSKHDAQRIQKLEAKSVTLRGMKFNKNVPSEDRVEKEVIEVDDLSWGVATSQDPISSNLSKESRRPIMRQVPNSPDGNSPDDDPEARSSARGRQKGEIQASQVKDNNFRSRFSPSRNSPPKKRNANPIPALLRPKHRLRGPRDEIPPSDSKAAQKDTRGTQAKTSKLLLDLDSVAIPSKTGAGSSRFRHLSRSRSKSPCSSDAEFSKTKLKVKRKPAEFPQISPTSSPPRTKRTIAAFPDISPIASSKNSTLTKSKISTSRVPAAFPSLSPSKFNYLNDDTQKVRNDKGKSRAVDNSDDEIRYEKKKSAKEKEKAKTSKRHRQLEAFPMNMQMLQDIGSLSPIRPRKRLSEDGSGDDRTSKRSKQELRLRNQSPRHLFEDEGDSITISPHVDPSTLCPYCDSPLPSTPSRLLIRTLAETKKKSQRDPRPSNPLGRSAPLRIFVSVCQRHRFESQILPEAERKGWPKSIDWKRIGSRILKMRATLQSIIQDPAGEVSESAMSTEEADPNDWDVLYESRKAKKKRRGAKAESVFWVEAMGEVRQQGLRSMTGVRGQFANFDKAQPGYYGETGAVIIQQTLYNMFPPDEIDPTLIAPLTSNQFVQRILVPEVALRLIMEDKKLIGADGFKDALTILRDSSAYGVAMFPEDGGEWDSGKKNDQEEKLGVGDMIVMERARKRRKELEEEDEREEREEQQRKAEMEEAERKREDKEKRARARQKAKEDENNLLSSDTNAPEGPARPRPRPRPRPVARSSSNMDVMASDPPPTTLEKTPRARSRSRSVLQNEETDARSDNNPITDCYATDAEPPPRASSVEKRRSPSASESRMFEHDVSAPPSTTSKRMSSLRIESDSDASTKSSARRSRRQASRAPSASKAAGKRSTPLNGTEDEVEIVETMFYSKTPVQKRRIAKPFPMDLYGDGDDDDQATPRAKPKAEDLERDLPPLERAKRRTEALKLSSENKMPVGGQKPPTLVKPTRTTRGSASEQEYDVDRLKEVENFGWLLSDHSSPSQEKHLKLCNK